MEQICHYIQVKLTVGIIFFNGLINFVKQQFLGTLRLRPQFFYQHITELLHRLLYIVCKHAVYDLFGCVQIRFFQYIGRYSGVVKAFSQCIYKTHQDQTYVNGRHCHGQHVFHHLIHMVLYRRPLSIRDPGDNLSPKGFQHIP